MIQNLGVKIAPTSSTLGTSKKLLQTRLALKRKGKSNLLQLPDMNDRNKKAATEMLGLLAVSAWEMGDENRCIMSCLHQFELTVKHGVSEWAPYAIATMGGTEAFLGNMESAFEFGKIARDMMVERPEFEKAFAAAGCPLYTVVWHLKRPLMECLDGLHTTYRVGMRCGDSFYACFASRSWGILGVFVGKTLPDHERYVRLSKVANHQTTKLILAPQ